MALPATREQPREAAVLQFLPRCQIELGKNEPTARKRGFEEAEALK